MVYKLSCISNIWFFCFFLVRVPPCVKNGLKYFFVETWQFIHHLKALVELRRFLLLLKSFRVFLVEKYSKNSEKIWIFDFFYKIVKTWKNSSFIVKTMMLNSKKKFLPLWTRFCHKKDDFKLKLKNSQYYKKNIAFFHVKTYLCPNNFC